MSFYGVVFRVLALPAGILLILGDFTIEGVDEPNVWTKLAGVAVIIVWVFAMWPVIQERRRGY